MEQSVEQSVNQPVIWWIRRDMRLTDNQALTAAVASGRPVIPLFVLDPKLLHGPTASAKRTAFLLGGLRALDTELRARGSRLIVSMGEPVAEVGRIAHEHGAAAIYAERDHTGYARARDLRAAALPLPVSFVDGVTARPVTGLGKDDGTPYTVYTPFSKRWRLPGPLTRADLLPAPARIETPDTLPSLALPDGPALPADYLFPPGEGEAKRRLGAFLGGEAAPVFAYGQQRDLPGVDATSGLSPYLRFGMISARLAAVGAYEAAARAPDAAARKGADVWLNELIWREFYVAILHHFPHVQRGSFRPAYDRIQWRNDPDEFAAWWAGQTGYPLVDAAMRQLAATGWMHNRVRMVAASFLVKDLLIDWRWGERWFMQQLVDGDPASNNGGWQWTAGTGTDAAPYFRVFNPVAQGQKFDPTGGYVRRWVPELERVPAEYIHAPWEMARSEQLKARCVIGTDYPSPIVEHGFARERVLSAYGAVGGGVSPGI